jgi:hypothetical protein
MLGVAGPVWPGMTGRVLGHVPNAILFLRAVEEVLQATNETCPVRLEALGRSHLAQGHSRCLELNEVLFECLECRKAYVSAVNVI